MNNIRMCGSKPEFIGYNSNDIKRVYLGDVDNSSSHLIYNTSDFLFETTNVTDNKLTFPTEGGSINLEFNSKFKDKDGLNMDCPIELTVPDWVTYQQSTSNSSSFVLTTTSNADALDARIGVIIAKQKFSNKEIEIDVFQDCNFGVQYSTAPDGMYYMMSNSRRLITYQQAVDNNIGKKDIEGIVWVSILWKLLVYKELIETNPTEDLGTTSTATIGYCGDYSFLNVGNTEGETFSQAGRRNTLYMYLKHSRSEDRSGEGAIIAGPVKSVLSHLSNPTFSDGRYGYLPSGTEGLMFMHTEFEQLADRINLLFSDEQKQLASPTTGVIFCSFSSESGRNIVYKFVRDSSSSYTVSVEDGYQTIKNDLVTITSQTQRVGALLFCDLDAQPSIYGILQTHADGITHNDQSGIVYSPDGSGTNILYVYNRIEDITNVILTKITDVPVEDINTFVVYTMMSRFKIGLFGYQTDYTCTNSRPVIFDQSNSKELFNTWNKQKDLLFLFDLSLPDNLPKPEYGTYIADIDSLYEGVYIYSINGYVYTKEVWTLHNYKSDYADGILIIYEGKAVLLSKRISTFSFIAKNWINGGVVTDDNFIKDYDGFGNWNKLTQYYASENAGSLIYEAQRATWFYDDSNIYLPASGELTTYYHNQEEVEELIELIGGETTGSKKMITSSVASDGLIYIVKNDNTQVIYSNGVLAGSASAGSEYIYRMCKQIPYKRVAGGASEVPDGVYLLINGTLFNAYSYYDNKQRLPTPTAVAIKEGNELFGYCLGSTSPCRLCNYIDNPPTNMTSLSDDYNGKDNTQWLIDNGHTGTDYAATVATNVNLTIKKDDQNSVAEQCFIGNYSDWNHILSYTQKIERVQNVIDYDLTVDQSWASTLEDTNLAFYIRNNSFSTNMADLVSDNDGSFYVTPVFKITI